MPNEFQELSYADRIIFTEAQYFLPPRANKQKKKKNGSRIQPLRLGIENGRELMEIPN